MGGMTLTGPEGESTTIMLQTDGADESQVMIASLEDTSQLISKLVASPLVTAVMKMQQEVVQCALDELAEALHLTSIRMPTADELATPVTDERNASLLLDSLVDKNHSAESIKIAQKVFTIGGAKDVPWPSLCLLGLVKSLLEVSPSHSFSVSLEAFSDSSQEAPVWTDKNSLVRFLEFIVPMSHIAATLAFLRARACAYDQPIVRDFAIKGEIELAMNFAKSSAAKQSDLLAAQPLPGHLMGAPWRSSAMASSKAWFSAVVAIVPPLAKFMLTKILAPARELSMSVHSFTPKFDHVVNSDKFSLGLARRSLLNWPSRSQLNERTIQLFHMLSALSRLHIQWGLEGNFREDPDMREDLDEAYNTFGRAREAITAIAAVNILAEMHGDEQRAKAQDLLMKKREQLSKLLQAELEKVCK